MQVQNVPIYRDGKVVSMFSGDDSTLAQTAQSLGGSLTATNTPAPTPTPAAAPTPPAPLAPLPDTSNPSGTPTLPDTGAPKSPLVSFADSLNAAVNLARDHRNANSLAIMGPGQGTVAASDFNGILKNMNAASDKTSTDAIKALTPAPSDVVTFTNDNGDVTAKDKLTGKLLWTAPGIGNKQNSTGASTKALSPSEIQQYQSDYPDAGIKIGDTTAIILVKINHTFDYSKTVFNGLQATLPSGQVTTFPSQQAVDQFKSDHGITAAAPAPVTTSPLETRIAQLKKGGILLPGDIRAALLGQGYTDSQINSSSLGSSNPVGAAASALFGKLGFH